MNPVLMIKMTENDKRVIIALLFVIIIIFVLIGIIGSIMIRTMKWQGKKCDTLVSDVVTNHIVKTPHQLRVYAAKKNIRLFIKQAWIGIIIILAGVATICIRNAIVKDWTYDPFNTTNGFGTLLFTWDFNDPDIYSTFFGKWKVISDWPKLANQPHFATEAVWSYIYVPCVVIGGSWYMIAAQAYLARTIRGIKLSKKVFEKSLENFDQNTPTPPQNNQPIQQ